MKKLLRSIGIVSALAATGACVSPVQAGLQDTAVRPGSFQAIMAIKSPGVYAAHLPAADVPEAASAAAPRPGSAEAVMAIKSPGVYGSHLAAANSPPAPATAHNTCRPGSFAAIMAVKLPPNARPGSPDLYRDCM